MKYRICDEFVYNSELTEGQKDRLVSNAFDGNVFTLYIDVATNSIIVESDYIPHANLFHDLYFDAIPAQPTQNSVNSKIDNDGYRPIVMTPGIQAIVNKYSIETISLPQLNMTINGTIVGALFDTRIVMTTEQWLVCPITASKAIFNIGTCGGETVDSLMNGETEFSISPDLHETMTHCVIRVALSYSVSDDGIVIMDRVSIVQNRRSLQAQQCKEANGKGGNKFKIMTEEVKSIVEKYRD
jgi:hypothetical protein